VGRSGGGGGAAAAAFPPQWSGGAGTARQHSSGNSPAGSASSAGTLLHTAPLDTPGTPGTNPNGPSFSYAFQSMHVGAPAGGGGGAAGSAVGKSSQPAPASGAGVGAGAGLVEGTNETTVYMQEYTGGPHVAVNRKETTLRIAGKVQRLSEVIVGGVSRGRKEEEWDAASGTKLRHSVNGVNYAV